MSSKPTFFQPTSLLYKTQLKVYYLLYNIIKLVQSSGFWYCFCSSIVGCQTKYGHKCWCMICILQLDEKFSIDNLEEIISILQNFHFLQNMYIKIMKL